MRRSARQRAFHHNHAGHRDLVRLQFRRVGQRIRDRVSPELVYFYHSFGLASQYFQQHQVLQLSATKPLVDVPVQGYYVMATYLLTGEQRTDYTQQIDPIRPFDRCMPMACPGAWNGVPRRTARGRRGRIRRGTRHEDRGQQESIKPRMRGGDHGLNWYLNKWVRAQLNWEHANFESR